VLRIIRWVVQSGHQAGIPVAICGEMATEPAYAIVLLGLGLDEFSMNPVSIPKVKKVLRMSRFEETRLLVEQLFQFQQPQRLKGMYETGWPSDFLKILSNAVQRKE